MSYLEEKSEICRVCLAGKVKMYGIKNRQLQVLYEVITNTKLDVAVGTFVTVCYICYSQLEKIRKFSEMAQNSFKRLKNWEDFDQITKVSECHLLSIQHNLTITVIPPISIYGYSNITEETVTVKEEYIKTEVSTSSEDSESLRDNWMDNPITSTPLHTVISSPKQTLKQTETCADKNDRKRLASSIVEPRNKPIYVKRRCTKIIESQPIKMPFLDLPVSSDSIKAEVVENKDLSPLSEDMNEPKNFGTSNSHTEQNATSLIANDKSKVAVKKVVYLSKLDNNQSKAIIEKTIQKLIELSTQEKKIHMNKPQPRPLPWCMRSQTLLLILLKLSGSEQAGTTLLTDRVFPLFHNGFAKEPSLTTLLEMAGYKNEPLQKKLFVTKLNSKPKISVAPHVRKMLPNKIVQRAKKPNFSITFVEKSSEENITPKRSSLQHMTNSFSLSNALKDESKRNRKEFVPINVIDHKMMTPAVDMKLVTADKSPSLICSQYISALNEMINASDAKLDNVISIKNESITHNNTRHTEMSSKIKKEINNSSSSLFQDTNINTLSKTTRITRDTRSQKTKNKSSDLDTQANSYTVIDLIDKDKTELKEDNVMEAMLSKFSKFKEKLNNSMF